MRVSDPRLPAQSGMDENSVIFLVDVEVEGLLL